MHTTLRLRTAVVLAPLLLTACMSGPAAPNTASSSSSSTATTSSAPHADLIVVTQPAPSSQIGSPLIVQGRARGPWYFEASFPVRLLDNTNTEISTGIATAEGEWMTEDFVSFSATLTFTTTAATGTLILENSNPSGMPQNAKSVSIPVQF